MKMFISRCAASPFDTLSIDDWNAQELTHYMMVYILIVKKVKVTNGHRSKTYVYCVKWRNLYTSATYHSDM